jgi:hypothetical protein
MADSGFKASKHYPGFNEAKTILYNAAQDVSASAWEAAADGTFTLDQNLSDKTLVIPITGLRVGDKLLTFRVVGALGATSSNATVVDADLRKVTKGAGAVTDASVADITQVSVEADTALDSEADLSEEVVATDYQYYVLVTGTTANNAANDIALCGVELDIIRA